MLLLAMSCFTPRIERAPDDSQASQSLDSFFDSFKRTFSPAPPDCDAAMFARTYARCEHIDVEQSFPLIWEAMSPPLSPERAGAFIGDHLAQLDRCCADSEAVVEIDLVVGCDGRVTDARVESHGALLPRWRQVCVRDEARSWLFDRPEQHEQGMHFLVTCGRRAK